MGECEFFGTCVNNPFETLEALEDVIDNSIEITKRTFMKHCEVDLDIQAIMRRFPHDYVYYRGHWQGKPVYFFTWSMIEHFFI